MDNMNFKKKIANATMDNRNLQKRSLQFKKSLDEIQKVLGEGKTKKKNREDVRKGIKSGLCTFAYAYGIQVC